MKQNNENCEEERERGERCLNSHVSHSIEQVNVLVKCHSFNYIFPHYFYLQHLSFSCLPLFNLSCFLFAFCSFEMEVCIMSDFLTQFFDSFGLSMSAPHTFPELIVWLVLVFLAVLFLVLFFRFVGLLCRWASGGRGRL